MIGELAGRQHGVVARRQLLALGLGERAIERRIEGGRLHRVHTGVYAVVKLHPRRGLLPHRAVLPRDERTTSDGIPVTTAARTLLDGYPGHRGTATPRTLLLDARRSTRSPLEAEFLEFVRGAGLPEPETNTIIEGYEVDAVWREARLIVELDGFATHGTRRAFERDREEIGRQLAEPGSLAQELLSWTRG